MTIDGPKGSTLDGREWGSGSVAVVLANPTPGDLCQWGRLIRPLQSAGYRVLAFDYGGQEPASAVAAAVRAIGDRGAATVAVVGALEGAKAALVEGTKIDLAAVVAISPARFAQGLDLVPIVRRLNVPSLYVYAAADFISSDTPLLYRSTASTDKKVVSLEGTDHAFDLLNGDQGEQVVQAVTAFLRKELPPGG